MFASDWNGLRLSWKSSWTSNDTRVPVTHTVEFRGVRGTPITVPVKGALQGSLSFPRIPSFVVF